MCKVNQRLKTFNKLIDCIASCTTPEHVNKCEEMFFRSDIKGVCFYCHLREMIITGNSIIADKILLKRIDLLTSIYVTE